MTNPPAFSSKNHTDMPPDAPSKAICTVRLLGWIAGSLSVAVALGWLVFQISGIWSPMLIFPLLIGGLLGAMLVVLMRICRVHAAWVVYPVAIGAVALLVVSQHWLAYRETLSAMNEDIQLLQKAAELHPGEFQGKIPTPPEKGIAYLRDEASRAREIPTWFGEITIQGTTTWAFWVTDALLVLLPIWFLLWQGRRARKWCPVCRSWYRVTRKGRLRVPDAETLLTLLKKEEAPDDDQTPSEPIKDRDSEDHSQRFATLLVRNCEGHCGKTELTVLIPATSTFETFPLDNHQRHQVEAFLDGETNTQ